MVKTKKRKKQKPRTMLSEAMISYVDQVKNGTKIDDLNQNVIQLLGGMRIFNTMVCNLGKINCDNLVELDVMFLPNGCILECDNGKFHSDILKFKPSDGSSVVNTTMLNNITYTLYWGELKVLVDDHLRKYGSNEAVVRLIRDYGLTS